jgi:hypothetical protein
MFHLPVLLQLNGASPDHERIDEGDVLGTELAHKLARGRARMAGGYQEESGVAHCGQGCDVDDNTCYMDGHAAARRMGNDVFNYEGAGSSFRLDLSESDERALALAATQDPFLSSFSSETSTSSCSSPPRALTPTLSTTFATASWGGELRVDKEGQDEDRRDTGCAVRENDPPRVEEERRGDDGEGHEFGSGTCKEGGQVTCVAGCQEGLVHRS